MSNYPLTGGCLCGAVRYSVGAPARCLVHCHCSQCRRSHATLIGTSATLDRDQLAIDKGLNDLTSFEYPPGNHRSFCRVCGSSIYYVCDEIPEVLFYFPATLDDGSNPGHADGAEHHIHVTSKVEWELIETSLPTHDEGVDRATLMNKK